ncbi:MAG TPA: hypothetical protein P5556_02900 [Candidatus Gastranaerophilales bacterium]|nr:hypothetical protein [Candidatus Gastranaerophilales bacterium]
MIRSCKKIFEKIKQTEKILKTEKSVIPAYTKENAHKPALKVDYEVIEEFKSLKENINADRKYTAKLAYQPVVLKSRKWE